MSHRDKRRDSGRRDGRRTELRLLEDEPATDRYDRPVLWSRDEPGPPSHGRRSRRSGHYRSGPARRPPAGGARGGEDRLLDDWDREDWHDRYRALRARSRWPLAFTAAGVVLLFFGGLMVVQPPGTSGVLGGPCMTVSCDRTTAPASVPATPSTSASSPPAAPPSAPASATPSSSPSPSVSSPAATAPASPAPSVNPALRLVQVSYSLVRHGKNGFQGQFTIVNRARSAIRDWRLTVTLPDDDVQSAWDGSFSESGDTVTFVPPAYALSIPAGARVTEQFTATGATLRPVSCMFSGAPC